MTHDFSGVSSAVMSMLIGSEARLLLLDCVIIRRSCWGDKGQISPHIP